MLMNYSSVAFASYQESDYLFYKDNKYVTYSHPLTMYFKTKNIKKHKFNCKTFDGLEKCASKSSNIRGYIANWEIDEGVLFLKGLENIFDESIDLKNIFSNKSQNERMKATWYSGELKISDGKVLDIKRETMGYGTIFERDVIFDIQFGKVISVIHVNNTN